MWGRGHRLTLEAYATTGSFPRDELFGLTGQWRRAAASILANITEGCGRNGDAELDRFVDIAMGSANEPGYHLILARDLGYLPPDRYERPSSEAEEITSMLAAFTSRLRHGKR